MACGDGRCSDQLGIFSECSFVIKLSPEEVFSWPAVPRPLELRQWPCRAACLILEP